MAKGPTQTFKDNLGTFAMGLAGLLYQSIGFYWMTNPQFVIHSIWSSTILCRSVDGTQHLQIKLRRLYAYKRDWNFIDGNSYKILALILFP
jgi:hypothetical protein